FDIDTTAFTNGVHTIAWSVTDNAGNSQGIGSRYFSIQNFNRQSSQSTGTASVQSVQEPSSASRLWEVKRKISQLSSISEIPSNYVEPLQLRKGYKNGSYRQIVSPDPEGVIQLKIKELERVTLQLGEHVRIYTGHLMVNDELRPLPIGSKINTGTFYWQPGPGFIGNYQLLFVGERETGELFTIGVHVTINPKRFGN
ncbi:MAG: hypothetical protein GY940_38615, partial [bacterium]|nr:hypothetical protein [bacterium]